jgi:S-DNA-T family DNA segregation ATPase FtsK/SpoIIIE
MLFRATPNEVQFIMIDPKRVELSLWDGIPHLMHPVVKDVKQAAGIFRAALKEMDHRYDLFARIGTRNIDGYNSKVDFEERLPYLVIVVDELADLMMQAAAEIETSICRLAQLARATGIHLVIATQRPSVDVITGLIKANISSRIAFAVSSQVDSRTILDQTGAERLIGRGDMLFMPIDAMKPMRMQGCFLSEQETNDLVKYLKERNTTSNYTLTPVDVGTSSGGFSNDPDGEDDDEFYEAAVKLVVLNGQASTSMLQRRFKIGYTRAARLIDNMQDRGIVGPPDGAKPREILISRDEVDRMFDDNPFK